MQPQCQFLIRNKLYCFAVIHEVCADGSLGYPSVRQAQRYQMMHWHAACLQAHH